MANKQETKKRRVAAANQVARQQAIRAKADRRKRIVVGGIVGFLALALIAPLATGLLLSDNGPQQAPTTTTVGRLPWASGESAGATITGPTPCPATDGTAERTTQFAEAPPLCIEAGAVYDLTFDTSAGSFSLPIDSNTNVTAANLATVMAWYRAYEQTPVTAVPGLMLIGSQGDAGFTVPVTAPPDPVDDLYTVGSVVALPSLEGGITGTLVVILDEVGLALIRSDPRFVPVGLVEDLAVHQTVYDAADPAEFLLVDTVTVDQVG